MAKYLHYAHLKDISVSEGDVVSGGHIIGHLGKTGTQYAHLHFEVHKSNPETRGWSKYTQELTREEVMFLYEDPHVYLSGNDITWPSDNTYLKSDAYDYLDWTGSSYHPGIDLNWGSGNDDEGFPVRATEYAKCIKVLYNDGGWGNHVYFEILTQDEIMAVYVQKDESIVLQTGGKKTGAIYKIDYVKKKKYRLKEGEAGLLALAKMAGAHMDETKLAMYADAESLAEVS